MLTSLWRNPLGLSRSGGGPPRAERQQHGGAELLVVLFYYYRLEIFGFKNLAAIETFHVLYPIAAGDDLGAVMITGGLHKQRFNENYSNRA
jgi:hypothetical protein